VLRGWSRDRACWDRERRSSRYQGASKNEKSHGGQEGGEKYSCSCGTVNRLWEAEETSTVARLERLAETEIGFAIPSQTSVI